jgi:hypothetical protein
MDVATLATYVLMMLMKRSSMVTGMGSLTHVIIA